MSDTLTGNPMTSPTPSLPATIREALKELVKWERREATMTELYERTGASLYGEQAARDKSGAVDARTALEAHLLALVAAEEQAKRERDAWRWAHWGHPDASWACECGAVNGAGLVQCAIPDCEAWRPMKPAILAEVQAGAIYDAALVAKHRAIFGTPPEDTTPHE